MNIKTLLSILAIAVALFVARYPYFSGSYNLDKAIIMTQAFIISGFVGGIVLERRKDKKQ